TDEQGYGRKNIGPIKFDPGKGDYNRLVREYEYVGPAWYQRQIEIPPEWSGKHITLFLERCHWETSLWIDGEYVGSQNSLSIPHVYDISELANPGEHTLTICVDNTLKLNISHHILQWRWTHAITDETQTNWNGIIGKLELNACDLVYIQSQKVFPQVDKQRIKVITTVENTADQETNAAFVFEISGDSGSNDIITYLKKEELISTGTSEFTTYISFPDEPHLWNEFEPFLYKLRTTLHRRGEGNHLTRDWEATFGMRSLGIKGDHLTLNGHKIFLRSNLGCCIYPLTGYPPMSTERWLEVIRTIKNYGMNGIRFHSWCPPEAAFRAADQEGMILQVEAPLWDGNGQIALLPDRAKFIQQEVNRIIDQYGNHPSFCLLSMGNELGEGNEPYLQELVASCQVRDPRHLYTCTTAPYSDDRNDDFYVAGFTPKGRAYGYYPPDGSMATTDHDVHLALEDIDRPFIVHEMGWPAMFPDLREISKYTGNLKPYNFIEYRKSLEEHNLLPEADNFRRSTGAFTVLLYKYLIEQSLKTDNSAGFQLLSLQDFPGQGVALIGILDAFLESKQLITPEQWRQFCSATVPLLRTKQWIWHSNEILTGQIEIYHYGPDDLRNVDVLWEIRRMNGALLDEGVLGSVSISAGGISHIGKLQFPLTGIEKAQQLLISVAIDGTEYKNSWPLWVYPGTVDKGIPSGITVTSVWNESVKTILENGGKVLFNPPKATLRNGIDSHFYPVGWNHLLFPPQPRTMGIICDPRHPALADFPTEFHTNWQWYDLLQGYTEFPMEKFPGWNQYDWMKGYSDAIVLNDAPIDLKPIVSFI
ncbi:MAG: glycoside hydrolase family 2, partial [Bacteroidetes bacterium]|nr:glycoside hydrolase family 2 [Bacteroidota bacterium]